MGALRGHQRPPLGEVTLALAPALVAHPPFFSGGGVFKELPEAPDLLG